MDSESLEIHSGLSEEEFWTQAFICKFKSASHAATSAARHADEALEKFRSRFPKKD